MKITEIQEAKLKPAPHNQLHIFFQKLTLKNGFSYNQSQT